MSYYWQASWRRKRREVLARDGWRCRDCGKSIRDRDAHVHHKLPRALGGTDIEENLISLCARCHSLKHANLHVGLGERFLTAVSVRIAKLFGGPDVQGLPGYRLKLALRYLGVRHLRSNQIEPILAALNGDDVLLISPTGSGKSICFQVPALLGPSHSIVISPLKALMVDQVLSLLARDVPATFLNSDLSRSEVNKRVSLIKGGLFKLVYLAPERFVRSNTRAHERKILIETPPSYLIVDEAHCIDKWGDAFRPAYREIGSYRKELGSPPVLAFTATANQATRREIITSLGAQNAKIFVEDVDRKNIALLRLRMHDHDDRVKLIQELHEGMTKKCLGKTLVFVSTKKQGERVRDLLEQKGVDCKFFHGSLNPMEREAIIQDFAAGEAENPDARLNLLICTNAFGMGMDIPNIRLVFHWQHSPSVEDFAQEFGRAGRDGAQSLAVVFSAHDDAKLLYFMARKSVENSKLPDVAHNTALEKRVRSIEKINSFVEQHDKCFTQLLMAELGVDERRVSGISRFFLELAFGAHREKKKRAICCDGCWRRMNNGPVSDFGRRVVELMGETPQSGMAPQTRHRDNKALSQ